MKPTDDMHKLIKKLKIKASPELDRRIHNDISAALAESKPAVGPDIWKFIAKGGIMKLAVAAAIIIAFGVGFFIGQRSESTQSVIYLVGGTGHTPAKSAYSADESSFWQQKAVAAMQPRPYAQSRFGKTGLLQTYKQYLKERHYD